MNSLRSPAPAASLFNVGGFANTKKNNRMMVDAMNKMNNAANSITNAANSITNRASAAIKEGPSASQIILIVVFTAIFAFVAIYWQQVRDGFRYLYERIRSFFGASNSPPPTNDMPNEPVTQKPEAPQNDTVHEKRMVEKILPGRQQVFNISKNSYTYYDAEPLCKALGAELATYEQVKQAYSAGADWCNYGWVKGQMAVYPTQRNTWEDLQSGPEAQRGACGQPGLNGGFFDNPELRFGVSCYGIKPDQKDHDATAVASGEGAPLSPGGLEFDKKVQKYRGEADNIAILPYNKSAWSS